MNWLVLMVCCLSSVAAAKTFKCEVDGKTAYQMSPCPAGKGYEIEIVSKQPVISAVEKQMRSKNLKGMLGVKARQKNRDIKRKTGISKGMTKAQVKQSIGTPDAINSSQYGDVEKDQWVYRHIHKTHQYVYFENGVVTSQQY